jgi:hypothetical protein
MKRFLNRWFSTSATPARTGRGRCPHSFRPALETLEDRQLLTAIPAHSTLVGNEDFVLYKDGALRRLYDGTGLFGPIKDRIDSNVVSLSVGLDNSGSGMVAYVKADGTAHEWSDTRPGIIPLSNPALGITNNVKSVAASDWGSAFVLTTSGEVFFYQGPASNRWVDLFSFVGSVSAGSDSWGFPSCDVVTWFGTAYTWSLDGVDRQLTCPSLGVTNNIRSVSAGWGGAVFVLRNDPVFGGELVYYNTDANTWTDVGGCIRSVSASSDPNAFYASCEVVTTSGTAFSWSSSGSQLTPLTSPRWGITNNISSASPGANGISDVVLNDGTLWQFNNRTNQWTWLDSGVA